MKRELKELVYRTFKKVWVPFIEQREIKGKRELTRLFSGLTETILKSYCGENYKEDFDNYYTNQVNSLIDWCINSVLENQKKYYFVLDFREPLEVGADTVEENNKWLKYVYPDMNDIYIKDMDHILKIYRRFH